MRRRLFHICAVISLLMFGLVGSFWGRSYGYGDYVSWDRQNESIELYSSDGLLEVDVGVYVSDKELPASGWYGSFWPFVRQNNSFKAYLKTNTILGFRFHHSPWGDGTDRGDIWEITAPHWFLAAITSILPLIALRRWIRKRNRNPFACIACGYDLRATPDRCPECGAVPKIKPPEPRTQ